MESVVVGYCASKSVAWCAICVGFDPNAQDAWRVVSRAHRPLSCPRSVTYLRDTSPFDIWVRNYGTAEHQYESAVGVAENRRRRDDFLQKAICNSQKVVRDKHSNGLIGNPDKCNYGEILPLEMRRDDYEVRGGRPVMWIPRLPQMCEREQ
ncbi:hypothetical protein QTP88_007096 [Uroleucon formosanum]